MSADTTGADQAHVRVIDIVMRFGGLAALDSVSLELQRGQISGVIGPNGSGKSTLVNCITGHYIPTSGSIRIDGSDVTKASQTQRARSGIARTFQNLLLFNEQSVFENVLFGSVLRQPGVRSRLTRGGDEYRDETDALIDRVGLSRYRDNRVSQIPYAAKKLCEFARAIHSRPHVLLLDEPTAGLGADDRRHFIRVITDFSTEIGCTTLVVSHDLDVIFALAQTVYVMGSGKVCFVGDGEAVRASREVRELYLGGAG